MNLPNDVCFLAPVVCAIRVGRGRAWAKRGGARVVTYAIDKQGKVLLLAAYTKAALDNLSAATPVKLRKELIDV